MQGYISKPHLYFCLFRIPSNISQNLTCTSASLGFRSIYLKISPLFCLFRIISIKMSKSHLYSCLCRILSNISQNLTCTSASVGFCPMNLKILPNSFPLITPSLSLSNLLKAALYFLICSEDRLMSSMVVQECRGLGGDCAMSWRGEGERVTAQ